MHQGLLSEFLVLFHPRKCFYLASRTCLGPAQVRPVLKLQLCPVWTNLRIGSAWQENAPKYLAGTRATPSSFCQGLENDGYTSRP